MALGEVMGDAFGGETTTSTAPVSGVVPGGASATVAVRVSVRPAGTATPVALMPPTVTVGRAAPSVVEASWTPVIVMTSPMRALVGVTEVIPGISYLTGVVHCNASRVRVRVASPVEPGPRAAGKAPTRRVIPSSLDGPSILTGQGLPETVRAGVTPPTEDVPGAAVPGRVPGVSSRVPGTVIRPGPVIGCDGRVTVGWSATIVMALC